MNLMNMKKVLSLSILLIFLNGCFMAPGMHMPKKDSVYIKSIGKTVDIIPINESSNSKEVDFSYKIGSGDEISVVVWGLPEIFPIINITPDQNLRRVDQNGDIFFAYAGLIKAAGKTQNELRKDITDSLSKLFNEPQVDVTISRFNSQQIFVLGEVTRPLKINITDIPITLSKAIGDAYGLNTITAAKDVFIIRQENFNSDPKIYYANLKDPSYFIDAGRFYLKNNDIIYVNSSGTTRWNKVISQFFPFSALLSQVSSLGSN